MFVLASGPIPLFTEESIQRDRKLRRRKSMPSPFPGMDLFLEAPKHWPVFQHGFMDQFAQAVQKAAGDAYRVRLAQRCYVHEQVLFISVTRDEYQETYLEIRQRSTGKLVTAVDLISPGNRTTETGRKAYVARRQEVRQFGANVVELDLVLQGNTCLEVNVADLPAFDYAVSVCRARQTDRFELYTTTLSKRLPRIRLPLAADDRDTIIDVQSVVSRTYDLFFEGKIDYAEPPPVLLKEADARWVVETLKQHRRGT